MVLENFFLEIRMLKIKYFKVEMREILFYDGN